MGDAEEEEEDVSPPPELIEAAISFVEHLEQTAASGTSSIHFHAQRLHAQTSSLPVMTCISTGMKIYELMKVFLMSSGSLLFNERVTTPLRRLLRQYYVPPRVLRFELNQVAYPHLPVTRRGAPSALSMCQASTAFSPN